MRVPAIRPANLTAQHTNLYPLIQAARTIGVELNADQLDMFRLYIELLAAWGKRMNLTAIRGRDDVVQHLFIRSLRVALPAGGKASTAEWFAGRRLLDVGSGAGFPGLPLKIVFPSTHVTLLEARGKVCSFLRTAVQELGVDDVDVLNERAEVAAHRAEVRESYDIVTARGVALLPTLAELTLPFVSLGGVAVLPKGPDETKVSVEAKRAQEAIDRMGSTSPLVQLVDYPGTVPADYMVYLMKIRPTPPEYPRRDGVPGKRPLLASSDAKSLET